jgi:hypothetical protein
MVAGSTGQPATLRLLQEYSLGVLTGAVEQVLAIGATKADAVRFSDRL